MTQAAFQAEYADWKLVKTRKVVQIVFEVPVEKAGLAYDVLGGMPNFGSEVWCAIARLKQPKENEAQPRPPLTESPSSAGGAQHRRPFTSLPLPQQAALLCADPVFRAFLHEEFGFPTDDSEKSAAETLRLRYDIKSRSEIKPDSHAGVSFIKDREQFMAWKLVSA